MNTESPSNQAEATRRPIRIWFRRFVLMLALGGIFLISFRDRPEVRLLIARTADFAYSKIDPFSESYEINFGPDPASKIASSNHDLKQLFPEYEITVNLNQAEIPQLDAIEFAHEWLGHDRVRGFKEKLPFELTSSTSVFEMSQLVRSLTEHGETSLPNVGTNPIAYLKFATEGRPLTCRYFSILFGATAKTAGYTSRLFTLSKNGRARSHAVAEVYVPSLSKWVLIDADFNIAYKKDGVWLNAKELHHAWIDLKQNLAERSLVLKELENAIEQVRSLTGVEVVELGPAGSELRDSNMYSASPTGINLEFYQYVIFRVRNDYLSAKYPVGHPVRTREYVLQEDANASLPPIADTAYVIEDIEKFYWPVGRSHIAIDDWGNADSVEVDLTLSTWTPNFQEFEIRFNEETWTKTDRRSLQWELQLGKNMFEARSVNLAGLRGETSRVEIQLTSQTAESEPR